MHKLNKLADFIETLNEKQIQQRFWMKVDPSAEAVGSNGGWATSIFPDLKFIVYFKDYTGYEALSKFFEIDFKDTCYCFDPTVSEKETIVKRCREIAEKYKEDK